MFEIGLGHYLTLGAIIFSIGVIHHIPNYREVLKKINQSLKENGQFIIWVYGKEGNET